MTPDIGKTAEGEPSGNLSGWSAGSPPPPPYHPGFRRSTNNLALASLIVGLVSLMSCPLIGGVAVYLGNRARAEIRSSGEDGDGLAQAGVIIGWCAVGLSALMALFLVIYLGFIAVMISTSSL